MNEKVPLPLALYYRGGFRKRGKEKKEYNTQGRGYVDIDVEIEASVFEKAEATLPFLGPVTELHEVADAVW